MKIKDWRLETGDQKLSEHLLCWLHPARRQAKIITARPKADAVITDHQSPIFPFIIQKIINHQSLLTNLQSLIISH